MKNNGWFKESERHRLSREGVSTKNNNINLQKQIINLQNMFDSHVGEVVYSNKYWDVKIGDSVFVLGSSRNTFEASISKPKHHFVIIGKTKTSLIIGLAENGKIYNSNMAYIDPGFVFPIKYMNDERAFKYANTQDKWANSYSLSIVPATVISSWISPLGYITVAGYIGADVSNAIKRKKLFAESRNNKI
jgi:hypothetical protein